VAAGEYAEDVVITGKSVRLWGRCPAMTEVVGTATEPAAVFIQQGASSSEVRGMAITGPGMGLLVSGSTDVVADSLWIHDTGDLGCDFEVAYGDTSGTLQDTLIEGCEPVGLFVYGGELAVERVAIRSTQQPMSGFFAGQLGYGLFGAVDDVTGQGGIVTIGRSLFEDNSGTGIYSFGGTISLTSSVVQATRPDAAGTLGRGISAESEPMNGLGSQLELVGSVVADNHDQGVFLSGGTLTMTATVVRDTGPDQDGLFGRGINVQASPTSALPATLLASQSLVDGNVDAGIFGAGAELTVESTVVLRTLPDATQWYGRGINLRPEPTTGYRASLWLRGSVLSENHDVGLFVGGADAFVERSSIQDTSVRPDDGGFGDGMTVVSHTDVPGAAQLVDSRVARSGRVGLANFGSTITLERVHVDCCPIALNGEQEYPYGEANVSLPFTFTDLEGNSCGCGDDQGVCQVLSTGVLPPDPGN
jgi:hypothetical protein